jgi:hypothetical protein
MRQWDLRSLEKQFKRNLLAVALQNPNREFAVYSGTVCARAIQSHHEKEWRLDRFGVETL